MTPVRSRRGAWLPGGRGRRLTNDTARQSVSIIIMPHFFNTNTIRGCPRPGAGINDITDTAFTISRDDETTAGGQRLTRLVGESRN